MNWWNQGPTGLLTSQMKISIIKDTGMGIYDSICKAESRK